MRLAALLLFIPSFGFTECPTGDDLTSGIRIFETNGRVETYTSGPRDTVVKTILDENGDGSENVLAQGIYMVATQDILDGRKQPGTRATYTYSLKSGELPEPVSGLRWTVEVVSFDADGLFAKEHVIQFGETTRLGLGDCIYDMIPIEVTYMKNKEVLYFLPELGFAPVVSWGLGIGLERFTFTGIEAIT
jgi:hypothetical protein